MSQQVSANISSSMKRLGLLERVLCPHCWHQFAPHEINWISAHPDLVGDPVAGEDEQIRFLPTRFNSDAKAIDPLGAVCNHLACPQCHLMISRTLLELKPSIFSILGAPGSGKSFFLSSMIWQLRKILEFELNLSFSDSDPVTNQILNGYEETLFLNANPDKLVTLAKTEKEGDLYHGVRIGERLVWYPKPFVFTIQPNAGHPFADKAEKATRSLCLYDNAGEHFLPGGEGADSPGTQHLAISEALLFVFDPTQHTKVRDACQAHSQDPQIGSHGWSHRQDTVLLEAANRIRQQTGLSQREKYNKPLIVVITKYDAWAPLLEKEGYSMPNFWKKTSSGMSAFDSQSVLELSQQLRKLFLEMTPEMVSAAEGFSNEVVYIPISALGHSPEVTEGNKFLGVRPKNIKPFLTELPLIYALHRCIPHLIPKLKKTSQSRTSNSSYNHKINGHFFVRFKGKETGPISAAKLRQLLEDASFQKSGEIRTGGNHSWKSASDYAGGQPG